MTAGRWSASRSTRPLTGHGDAYVQVVPGTARGRRERGLRLRGREHRPLDRPRQRVPAVAALRPRDRHADPQQVQQQRRRGRRVPQHRRRQRRPVGLARLPPEQRLPALELLGGGPGVDDGREHPARQPRLDGPGRSGRGQQRRDQLPDRGRRPAVPVRARRRRAAGDPTGPTQTLGAAPLPRTDRRTAPRWRSGPATTGAARPGSSSPSPAPRPTRCGAPKGAVRLPDRRPPARPRARLRRLDARADGRRHVVARGRPHHPRRPAPPALTLDDLRVAERNLPRSRSATGDFGAHDGWACRRLAHEVPVVAELVVRAELLDVQRLLRFRRGGGSCRP